MKNESIWSSNPTLWIFQPALYKCTNVMCSFHYLTFWSCDIYVRCTSEKKYHFVTTFSPSRFLLLSMSSYFYSWLRSINSTNTSSSPKIKCIFGQILKSCEEMNGSIFSDDLSHFGCMSNSYYFIILLLK